MDDRIYLLAFLREQLSEPTRLRTYKTEALLLDIDTELEEYLRKTLKPRPKNIADIEVPF